MYKSLSFDELEQRLPFVTPESWAERVASWQKIVPPPPFLIVLDYTGIFGNKTELRPKEELESLLSFLESFAVVGIYSSTMYKNIIPGLKKYNLAQRFMFIFDRTHTRLDPDYLIDQKVEEYDTVKHLDLITNNPVINTKRQYGIDNTIICDDSPRKIRYIHDDNALVLPTWTGSNNIEEIKSLILHKVEKLKAKWRLT